MFTHIVANNLSSSVCYNVPTKRAYTSTVRGWFEDSPLRSGLQYDSSQNIRVDCELCKI